MMAISNNINATNNELLAVLNNVSLLNAKSSKVFFGKPYNCSQ